MADHRLPRASTAVAHISNPAAAGLARAINKGGEVGSLLRAAFIDAQVHNDWKGVVAIENSLEREDDRTLARHLGNIAARALVVSRRDDGSFAARIPAGFDYGLAWLVCLVYVRTDADTATGFGIGQSFHDRVTSLGGMGIDWGPVAICLPPIAFGGPTRLMATEAASQGDPDTILAIQRHAQDKIQDQVDASSGPASSHSVSYVVWGSVVTGSEDPLRDLFDEEVWCPGVDRGAISAPLTEVLAAAAAEYHGDTFIHPECLSANEAQDFARMMANEQTIDAIVNAVVRPRVADDLRDAHVRITKIIPHSPPYMDQLLISFWGRANVLFQTFRLPRSGLPLDDDANRIADMCRRRGIRDVKLLELARPIGANDAPGYAVGADGRLISPLLAAIGDATSLIQKLDWRELDESILATQKGTRQLPAVLAVEKQGALSVLGEHYTPSAWLRIKEALAAPGDPCSIIAGALRRTWAGPADDLTWLLDRCEQMMLPSREVALAAQFKLAQGAIVKATPSLLELLAETDIGDDCPAMYLRAGFDLMYLVLRVPAASLDEPDDDDDRCYIDGVLVQRWSDSAGQHLLLEAFLTAGKDVNEPETLLEAVPLRFTLDDDATLGALRGQITEADQDLLQVLDLYAGVMLYMNSRDARVINGHDRTDAAAALSAMNRKKRRPEHYQALNSAVDAICVGPEAPVPGAKQLLGEHGCGGLRPHYRRGFVRFGQRVGKGRVETRPVFIPPVLVNAHKLLGSPPEKKRYMVGRHPAID